MTSSELETDRTAIRALIQSQSDAWNRGDAAAFANGFRADGCFVNILGMLSYGREPFELQHAQIFATIYQDSRISLPIRRLHFLREDVALVDIDAELSGHKGLPPGMRTEPDGVIRTRLQEVLVKEAGHWTIASFHNVDIKPGVNPS
jgi:uncharacterized protein (TIGR02246 family)